jgi:hypothetical protein
VCLKSSLRDRVPLPAFVDPFSCRTSHPGEVDLSVPTSWQSSILRVNAGRLQVEHGCSPTHYIMALADNV